MQVYISPLHDRDVNPFGEPKKPHYHVILAYDGPKSYEQVKRLTDEINASAKIEKVNSLRGYLRYFCHEDNPEKAQYSRSDIQCIGGADLDVLTRPTTGERYALIGEMIDYIESNNVTEFSDFMNFARVHHMDDWFPLLCDSCAYVIGQVIKSQRHKPKDLHDRIDRYKRMEIKTIRGKGEIS